MAAADVVVCRASSGLVSEVAVIGVASVLVPWSGAAEDHQTANASVLVDVGAAEVISDADLSGARLGAAIEALIADPARREAMERACKQVARPDAAQRVADLVEEHARG
jgi:UDP-N-acetylglucosamine--N-acetylmuramyl-(pentapeptide) pyrophosphoryl-undecaprenol N-acetylglucosamine transferase